MIGGIAWLDHRLAQSDWYPWGGAIVFSVLTVAALVELAAILRLANLPVSHAVTFGIGSVVLVGAVLAGVRPDVLAWLPRFVAAGTPLLLAGLLLNEEDLAAGARSLAGSAVVILAATLMSGWLDVLARYGTVVLGATILTVKGADIGGYLVGRFLGRRSLCPRVSPNKTVEGAIGGLVFSLVIGLVLIRACGEGRWSAGELLLVAVLLNVASQLGDLLESVLKRAAGVKDSGQLLPEFGGALDMVDSLILAGPVAACALALLEG